MKVIQIMKKPKKQWRGEKNKEKGGAKKGRRNINKIRGGAIERVWEEKKKRHRGVGK